MDLEAVTTIQNRRHWRITCVKRIKVSWFEDVRAVFGAYVKSINCLMKEYVMKEGDSLAVNREWIC